MNLAGSVGSKGLKVGKFIAWSFTVVSGLAGVAAIGEGQLAPAAFFISSGLIALPPTNKLLRTRLNINVPAWVRGVLVLGLIAAAGAFLPPNKNSRSNTASAKPQASAAPSARSLLIAKFLLADDFESYLDGKKTIGDWSSMFLVGERITARQLFSAYHANEVAADDKFKDHNLTVLGTVESINKDVFDNGYLVLQDGNMFEGVHAQLSDDTMKYSGQLSRGDSVTLICKGGGMVVGSPILKNCDAVPVIVEQQRPKLENMVDKFLSGEDNPPVRIRLMIGIGYALGMDLHKGSACDNIGESSKTRCLDEVRSFPKARLEATYRELSKRFPLPPIPEHT